MQPPRTSQPQELAVRAHKVKLSRPSVTKVAGSKVRVVEVQLSPGMGGRLAGRPGTQVQRWKGACRDFPRGTAVCPPLEGSAERPLLLGLSAFRPFQLSYREFLLLYEVETKRTSLREKSWRAEIHSKDRLGSRIELSKKSSLMDWAPLSISERQVAHPRLMLLLSAQACHNHPFTLLLDQVLNPTSEA